MTAEKPTLPLPRRRGPKPLPLAERLWSRVKRGATNECWLWQGAQISGYGRINVSGPGGRVERAHRVAYRLTNGEIPSGLQVCHRCDTTLCCNPAHLFVGTARDNARDCHDKGRSTSSRLAREGRLRSKLTWDAVREIRSLRGKATQRELARRFGVSDRAIGDIMSGHAWPESSRPVDHEFVPSTVTLPERGRWLGCAKCGRFRSEHRPIEQGASAPEKCFAGCGADGVFQANARRWCEVHLPMATGEPSPPDPADDPQRLGWGAEPSAASALQIANRWCVYRFGEDHGTSCASCTEQSVEIQAYGDKRAADAVREERQKIAKNIRAGVHEMKDALGKLVPGLVLMADEIERGEL